MDENRFRRLDATRRISPHPRPRIYLVSGSSFTSRNREDFGGRWSCLLFPCKHPTATHSVVTAPGTEPTRMIFCAGVWLRNADTSSCRMGAGRRRVAVCARSCSALRSSGKSPHGLCVAGRLAREDGPHNATGGAVNKRAPSGKRASISTPFLTILSVALGALPTNLTCRVAQPPGRPAKHSAMSRCADFPISRQTPCSDENRGSPHSATRLR